ncbi:MAG: aldo/keto reductase [Acidobacteria bacterium]|nr:aldo/keto reductase [Acidobacteriota bacterium]
MTVKKRAFGRSGLEVSPLCLGGNVFGWTADEATSFRLLDAFVDAGLEFIDTADVYSAWVPGHAGGESETVIGNWLKKSGKRDKVVLATKVGIVGKNGVSLKKQHIFDSVDKSLKRLQTDVIDLYWAHKDDPGTPLEETLSAFSGLIASGKVRAIGASNYSGARLREALTLSSQLGLARYEGLQPHYNLVRRKNYQADLEPVALAEGLGVAPYFSLAMGFLTGKYRSEADLGKSPRGGGVKQYLTPEGLGVLEVLDAIARERESKPGTVALAWLAARKSVTAPIASATSPEQLAGLLKAVQLELSAEEIARLDSASAGF